MENPFRSTAISPAQQGSAHTIPIAKMTNRERHEVKDVIPSLLQKNPLPANQCSPELAVDRPKPESRQPLRLRSVQAPPDPRRPSPTPPPRPHRTHRWRASPSTRAPAALRRHSP